MASATTATSAIFIMVAFGFLLTAIIKSASVVAAVSPRPVNVLVGSDFTTVAKLEEMGVRRISVGGALARVAWAGFLEVAKEIADRGSFAGLDRAVPFAELDESFGSE